jgi:hypothetical protein
MTKIDDGGPAFPHGNPTHGGHPGMTLRDWFTGQALNGILSNPALCDGSEGSLEEVADGFAKTAEAIADAMIARRKEGGG